MANYLTARTYSVLLAALMLIPPAIAACGSSDSADATTATTTPTTVLVDTTSSTTAPPTTADPETTAAAGEIIELTFDGSSCTAAGPTVVPTGIQSFVVKDLTGESVTDMRTQAIADGHSYEDLIDLQSQPGEYFAMPEWAELALIEFVPIERDLAENEMGRNLNLEPGQHGMGIRTGEGLWLCGALEVTDS